MKPPFKNNLQLKSLISIFTILSLIIGLLHFSSCSKKKKSNAKLNFSPNELIFYLKDSADSLYLKELEKYIFSQNNSNNVTIEKCKCDQNLVKITSNNIVEQILDGQGKPAVENPPKGTGGTVGSGNMYASMPDNLKREIKNIEVNFQFSNIEPNNQIDNRDIETGLGKYSKDTLFSILPSISFTPANKKIIAILDGGLHREADKNLNYIWKNVGETNNRTDDDNNNMIDDEYGWNFAENNNNIIDPINPHGNNVAAFMAYELKAAGTNNVQLMNLKVLDKNNQGTLFGILCAILYAYQNKADIINLSLGYYGRESATFREILQSENYFDPNDPSKKKYKNKIIVAAAGNDNPSIDSLEMPGTDLRNLEVRTNKFYPAYFAHKLGGGLNNIMAVTTIDRSTNKVAINQNFSPLFVEGVYADRGFYFLDSTGNPFDGSSYATPILSAKIAKNLVDRNIVFKNCSLLRLHLLAAKEFKIRPPLVSQILGGHVAERTP